MLRLWIFLVSVALLSAACNHKGGEAPSKEPVASPKQEVAPPEEAAGSSTQQAKPLDTPAGEVAPPGLPLDAIPPLSRPEKILQDIAAGPEPFMGAVDLSMACNSAKRDKEMEMVRQTLPAMRLSGLDRDAVNAWFPPMWDLLRTEAAKDLSRIEIDLGRQQALCVNRWENNQAPPAQEEADYHCVAIALQDPGKCAKELDSHGECRGLSSLRKLATQVAAWDRKSPATSECDEGDLKQAFYNSQVCKAVVDTGCAGAAAAWRHDVCETVRTKKAPIACGAESQSQFWCRLEAVVNAPEPIKACRDLMRSGDFLLPFDFCVFVAAPTVPGRCNVQTEALIPVSGVWGVACGILSYALDRGTECKGQEEAAAGFCVGRLAGSLLIDGVEQSCDVLKGIQKEDCEAFLAKDPAKCRKYIPALEPMPEILDACRKPFVAVRQNAQATGAPVFLDAYSPKLFDAECTLVVTAPSEDGARWRFPIEVKLKAGVMKRVDVPASITKAEGVEVSSTCKWIPLPPITGEGPRPDPPPTMPAKIAPMGAVPISDDGRVMVVPMRGDPVKGAPKGSLPPVPPGMMVPPDARPPAPTP